MEGADEIEERIAQIKLRRLEDINESLSTLIEKERITVTNATFLILNHIKETPDYLVSEIWPLPESKNKYRQSTRQHIDKSQDPECCVIV